MSNKELLEKLKVDGELRPWMEHYLDWHNENIEAVLASEKIVVHSSGYAGTADLYCWMVDDDGNSFRALVDYKTQGVKSYGPRFYDGWVYQLVAYRACLPDPHGIRCVSVIINSNEPEPLVHKVWPDEDVDRAVKIFNAALVIWQEKKKFKPESA